MSPFLLDTVDPILADRLRKLAGKRGWSESDALIRVIERGLPVIEAEVPPSLEHEEADALQAAIAALALIPTSTFADIGKVPEEPEGS